MIILSYIRPSRCDIGYTSADDHQFANAVVLTGHDPKNVCCITTSKNLKIFKEEGEESRERILKLSDAVEVLLNYAAKAMTRLTKADAMVAGKLVA